jgi:cytoskeletal protein CcmA (bactofilin family)
MGFFERGERADRGERAERGDRDDRGDRVERSSGAPAPRPVKGGREMGKAPSNGINSLLGEGSSYEGTARVAGAVRVDGHWKGAVEVADTFVVGRTGVFDGQVHARDVIVCGRLLGKINATGSVELQKGCRFEGDVETPIFVVEEGVFFQGNCRMPPEVAEAAEASSVDRTSEGFGRTPARTDLEVDEEDLAGNGLSPASSETLGGRLRSAAG